MFYTQHVNVWVCCEAILYIGSVNHMSDIDTDIEIVINIDFDIDLLFIVGHITKNISSVELFTDNVLCNVHAILAKSRTCLL